MNRYSYRFALPTYRRLNRCVTQLPTNYHLKRLCNTCEKHRFLHIRVSCLLGQLLGSHTHVSAAVMNDLIGTYAIFILRGLILSTLVLKAWKPPYSKLIRDHLKYLTGKHLIRSCWPIYQKIRIKFAIYHFNDIMSVIF